MKIVSFASFKGGCGKTTAVMSIASMLSSLGKSVAIIEADIQGHLGKWKAKSQKLGTWDERCEHWRADDMQSFEKAYEEADGYDYILIDTHGGASSLNQVALVNSEFIIVPSGLSDLEVESTLETFEYATKLYDAENEELQIALLWQRFPTAKLTASEQSYFDALDPLQQFETKLHKRDAYTSLGSCGMLHLYHQKLDEDPKMRLKSRTYGTAVNEAEALTRDLLEVMGE